jgi:hypothetical protein
MRLLWVSGARCQRDNSHFKAKHGNPPRP